jgi:hypothetical protein
MNVNTSSSSSPNRPLTQSATDTRPFTDLAHKTIDRHSFGVDAPSGINSDLAPTSATSAPYVSRVSPTLTVAQPIEPSIDDAMSTSFIDTRSVGVNTWPIRGVHKWEGKIVEIGDAVFTVELTPLAQDDDQIVLTAEFRTKLLRDQSDSVQLGDIVYVTSQEVRVRGFLTTNYALHVRKPGNWTEADLRDIRERVRKRLQLLEDNVE